ncbi:bacitracin ABC transporter ATP-binding protein [Bacillus salipaludis]|uniref:Bacitracin ABC transporter ATP-binding protein n=1 Tax=Bacillus salipaludis TaxID=2547811 RepID=A0ABW8RGP6_9BACI
MFSHKKPLLTDEFLDELAKEISLLYGDPAKEQNEEQEHEGYWMQNHKNY